MIIDMHVFVVDLRVLQYLVQHISFQNTTKGNTYLFFHNLHQFCTDLYNELRNVLGLNNVGMIQDYLFEKDLHKAE